MSSLGNRAFIEKTPILLSNDLGQRDASDIPIWLPPGLSHVP